jgi:hypothetical protein
MIIIRKRVHSHNYFPERAEQNHRRTEHVAVVRRVGPRWVTAGRRPRAIPVFFIHRTILSVPPACALSTLSIASAAAGAVIPGVAQ